MAARHAGREAMSLLSTLLRLRQPRPAHRSRRIRRTADHHRTHPPRHLPRPVGRSVRDHRSREHPPARADLRRHLSEHPCRRPHGPGTVHHPRRPRGSPLRVQHRGGPPAMSDTRSPGRSADLPGLLWWRGQDLNLRPSGYEPDELPDCSTPRRWSYQSTSGAVTWQPCVVGLLVSVLADRSTRTLTKASSGRRANQRAAANRAR